MIMSCMRPNLNVTLYSTMGVFEMHNAKKCGVLTWHPKHPYFCTHHASNSVFGYLVKVCLKCTMPKKPWCPTRPYLCTQYASNDTPTGSSFPHQHGKPLLSNEQPVKCTPSICTVHNCSEKRWCLLCTLKTSYGGCLYHIPIGSLDKRGGHFFKGRQICKGL